MLFLFLLYMKIKISILFYLFFLHSYSQDSLSIKKYREDQIYFSGNYVLIHNTSSNISQSDFSNKISFGFIRDIPITQSGRWAIGIGAGSSFTEFKSYLLGAPGCPDVLKSMRLWRRYSSNPKKIYRKKPEKM